MVAPQRRTPPVVGFAAAVVAGAATGAIIAANTTKHADATSLEMRVITMFSS
jgi:hypothetical protein